MPSPQRFPMEMKQFNAGDIVFEEGEEAHEAFRIVSGKVEISVGTATGSRSLAQLCEGEIFGEMGLVAEKPRSATATALESTTLALITAENFEQSVLEDEQELRRYLATLIGRLRTTDALLQIALRKNQQGQAEKTEATMELSLATSQADGGPSGTQADCRLLLTSAYEPGQWRGDTIAAEITTFPYRIGCEFIGPEPPFFRNDLLIRDTMPRFISRDHCAIERNASGYYLRDRGSVEGTIVNGKPIGTKAGVITAPLVVGENVIMLGGSESPHRFFLHVMPGE